MTDLATGADKQFMNLLDAVAADPSVFAPRGGESAALGPCVGDDVDSPTRLGPCVGDDLGSPSKLGPCVGDDVNLISRLTELGPSVGDDVFQFGRSSMTRGPSTEND